MRQDDRQRMLANQATAGSGAGAEIGDVCPRGESEATGKFGFSRTRQTADATCLGALQGDKTAVHEAACGFHRLPAANLA